MVIIYTAEITPRIDYVVNFIFKNILGLDFIITNKLNDLNGIVVNYSKKYLEIDSYQIYPSGFLEDNNWEFANHMPVKSDSSYFFSQSIGDHNFDLLSAVFFLVSRMEEYNNENYDKHHRFNSLDSILVKLNLEKKPIIDIWCYDLLKTLNDKFKTTIKSTKSFYQFCTFDIDNAYAFKHKSNKRYIGSFLKDLFFLRIYKLKQRVKLIIGSKKDPYDNYDYIQSFCEMYNLKSIFFFLIGDYSKMDRNINFKNPALIKLIKSLLNDYKIGIHPSYNSFNNLSTLKKEISRLNDITSGPITMSRFHYLRFSLPESYQILIEAEIKEDYSMGYVDRIGFRAGTCTPFYFYDLKNEKASELKIIPFAYMDGVLNDKLKYSTEHAKSIIKKLKENVKQVNGQFNSVWHNESLSNQDRWKGWRAVFESTWLD